MAAPVLPVHRRLAAELCAATAQLLWPQRARWLARPLPDGALRVRAGSGRATYCQQERDRYTITYGQRMVSEKCVPELAAQWLTAREIHRRGFWGGNPSVAQLLAHTVCHEFAHLIQQANRWCRRGSVHNARFYEVLERLYGEGMAQRVHERLVATAVPGELDLHSVVAPPPRRHADPLRARFAPGDRVAFPGRGDTQWIGRIRRVNRTTATVIPEERRFRVSYFRVPFALLTAL